jgi:hypothetical protein
MENIQTAKKKLFSEIEQLSNPYIIMELELFIQYLKFKQSGIIIRSGDSDALQPEDDPVLRAFDLVDVAPFSDTIDDILYGVV